jgi:hypothetical protein
MLMLMLFRAVIVPEAAIAEAVVRGRLNDGNMFLTVGAARIF